jgi:hypothetical protein
MNNGSAITQKRRIRRRTEKRVFSRSVFLFLPALGILFAGGSLYGQTAADMDELLNSREITFFQACGFVLPAAGVTEEQDGAGAAFAAAREKGWLPKDAAAESPVHLGELSFLLAQSFSLNKSLLYTLFPGPRYAYRQLDYLGLLPALKDPGLTVSGERLLHILGRVLSYRGEEDAAPEWENITP